MKILITGAAGFIGAATARDLVRRGHEVVGLDNLNSYYDTGLKYARLGEAGIPEAAVSGGGTVRSRTRPGYRFTKADLTDRAGMDALFGSERFDIVVNLAAQAGVRYSIDNPFAYVESNVAGFLNVLENCRRHPVRHLVYASSSSVYGMGGRVPYAEDDDTDCPASLYAATKKSGELMAYCYSRLYGIPATGVRFFTVYGPWGRPDMAPYIFLRSVLDGTPIRVFNKGDMERDFTYIDDIVEGLARLVARPPASAVPHAVYNIGHSCPVRLLDFIRVIERTTGRKAVLRMEGMQPGDVYRTCADTTRLQRDFGYRPTTTVEEGMRRFYEWYEEYRHGGHAGLRT